MFERKESSARFASDRRGEGAHGRSTVVGTRAMDVKDILGVSRSASAVAERVEKVKEKKLVKPKGMSR